MLNNNLQTWSRVRLIEEIKLKIEGVKVFVPSFESLDLSELDYNELNDLYVNIKEFHKALFLRSIWYIKLSLKIIYIDIIRITFVLRNKN